jgi:hypothetical protein
MKFKARHALKCSWELKFIVTVYKQSIIFFFLDLKKQTSATDVGLYALDK